MSSLLRRLWHGLLGLSAVLLAIGIFVALCTVLAPLGASLAAGFILLLLGAQLFGLLGTILVGHR